MSKVEIEKKYTELEKFSLTKELFNSCKEHAGLVLIISYGLITASGMLYLYTFYWLKFDVPILSLITLQDAMLIGIKEPKIIVGFLLVLVFQLLSDAIIRWQAKAIKKSLNTEGTSILSKMKKSMLWVPAKRHSIVMSYTSAILVFNILIYSLAIYNADLVLKKGQGDSVVFTLEDSQKTKPIMLLGAINQFLITYDGRTKKAKLYNQETVMTIEGFTVQKTNPQK